MTDEQQKNNDTNNDEYENGDDSFDSIIGGLENDMKKEREVRLDSDEDDNLRWMTLLKPESMDDIDLMDNRLKQMYAQWFLRRVASLNGFDPNLAVIQLITRIKDNFENMDEDSLNSALEDPNYMDPFTDRILKILLSCNRDWKSDEAEKELSDMGLFAPLGDDAQMMYQQTYQQARLSSLQEKTDFLRDQIQNIDDEDFKTELTEKLDTAEYIAKTLLSVSKDYDADDPQSLIARYARAQESYQSMEQLVASDSPANYDAMMESVKRLKNDGAPVGDASVLELLSNWVKAVEQFAHDL